MLKTFRNVLGLADTPSTGEVAPVESISVSAPGDKLLEQKENDPKRTLYAPRNETQTKEPKLKS